MLVFVGDGECDLPGGAVNIVTGYVSQLLKTLAEHDDVDAIWCYGDEATVASAKAMSTGNLKQVWTNEGRVIDYQVLSGPQNPEVNSWIRQVLSLAQFTPATAFGKPVESRMILSFIAVHN